jgi:hypothetical protein
MTTTPILRCRACRTDGLAVDLDLGVAAVSHTPLRLPEDQVAQVPFRLAACRVCGLVQLADTPAVETLRSPLPNVQYRDPERHLDDLCAAIVPHLGDRSRLILGLSYKDTPLLDRFRLAGFTRALTLDRRRDWQFDDDCCGIETLQQRLTPAWAKRIRAEYGPVALLCVRHVLEHAHDVPQFLAGCRTLLADDGWVLFETPGAAGELARGDSGALWEEHVSYFTEDSLRTGLAQHGVVSRWVANYPYAIEDCLAAFGRFQRTGLSALPGTTSGVRLVAEFAAARDRLRRAVARLAEQTHSQGRQIALWGAGHRTTTLLQLGSLTDLVDCIIDDDPSKQGTWMPGSGLPVFPATALIERSIGCCVGVLNPDIVVRLRARESSYAAQGGQLLTLADIVEQAVSL